MRFSTLFTLIVFIACGLMGQEKPKFKLNFYGFVRADGYVNSRLNQESSEGVIYLYPLRPSIDPEGNDRNDFFNIGYNLMTTRAGLNVEGPRLGKAETSAKVEADFAGFSGSPTVLRLRQAYVKFDWKSKTQLLVGQTWHPLFSEVTPAILAVSCGMPYQPFNRSPQIQFRQHVGRFSFMAASIFQYQYTSNGPAGKSTSYAHNSVIPEFYLGASYLHDGLQLTLGGDVLTMRVRTQSAEGYKVREMLSTPSLFLAAKYDKDLWSFRAKTLYGGNFSHLQMHGGFGATSKDPVSGQMSYTPLNSTTTWVNVSYGKKYQVGVFGGYTKNLGSADPLLAGAAYGQALDMDQQYSVLAQFSYNIRHWTFGLEYSFTSSYYGTMDWATGRVGNTSPTNNHRVLGLMVYYF